MAESEQGNEPTTQSDHTEPPRPQGFTHFAVGAALGLLFGLMVGLSFSPILGGLAAAVLAAALGWNVLAGKDAAPSTPSPALHRAASLRLIGFSLLAALGLLGGIYLRTHNLLSPSYKDQAKAWRDSGFSEAEARGLALVERLGADRLGLLHPIEMQAWQDLGFEADEARRLVADRALASKPADAAPPKSPNAGANGARARDTGLFNHSVEMLDAYDPTEHKTVASILAIYGSGPPGFQAAAASAEAICGDDVEPERCKAMQRVLLVTFWKHMKQAAAEKEN